MKYIAAVLIILLSCGCAYVQIKYGAVEVSSYRLFEDQNLEGLTIIHSPDNCTAVILDKKSNAVNTETLSQAIDSVVSAAIQ